MATTEELFEAINKHLKEKKDYESKFSELEFKLQARKNTLSQADEAIVSKNQELADLEKTVAKEYAEKINSISARQEAVKLRENNVEHAEMSARQKANNLEQRESAVSIRENEVSLREKEVENKFGRMADFLVQAKDMLENFK